MYHLLMLSRPGGDETISQGTEMRPLPHSAQHQARRLPCQDEINRNQRHDCTCGYENTKCFQHAF